MVLIYSLIAYNGVILVEYPGRENNLEHVSNVRKLARNIINEKVTKEVYARNRSYGIQQYTCHYKLDDMGICYMVMVHKIGSDDDQTSISYKYLEDINNEFTTQYETEYQTEREGILNGVFGRIMQQKLEFWNNPNSTIKIKSEANTLTEKLINAFRIFDVQEQLDEEQRLINHDADELNDQISERKIWWQQKACQIISGVAMIVILIIILTLVILAVLVYMG